MCVFFQLLLNIDIIEIVPTRNMFSSLILVNQSSYKYSVSRTLIGGIYGTAAL